MAYQLAIEAHIGEYWSATLTVDQPATWTGWTARAQVRYWRGAELLLLELDTDLTTDGEITVSIPDGATADFPPTAGVWDLLVQQGDAIQYLAEGPVTITGRVTEPA
jgi:hypothetical protein